MAEQAIVQLCMTIYRFAAFAVMFITVIIGLSYPRPDFHLNTGVADKGIRNTPDLD